MRHVLRWSVRRLTLDDVLLLGPDWWAAASASASASNRDSGSAVIGLPAGGLVVAAVASTAPPVTPSPRPPPQPPQPPLQQAGRVPGGLSAGAAPQAADPIGESASAQLTLCDWCAVFAAFLKKQVRMRFR
jgi:hypothetical protein